VATTSKPNRSALVRRGQRLEYFTIGYNSLEGLVSIVAGAIAGSVSLIGFGLDSLIEVTSGAALLWPLHHDLGHSWREQVELSGRCSKVLTFSQRPETAGSALTHGCPLSGNIGSYAADSMVRRCGAPTPPPARAADSDTLDPGTVRPSVPVYDKAVSRPRSCRHAFAPEAHDGLQGLSSIPGRGRR
jgi:hypothetical protein